MTVYSWHLPSLGQTVLYLDLFRMRSLQIVAYFIEFYRARCWNFTEHFAWVLLSNSSVLHRASYLSSMEYLLELYWATCFSTSYLSSRQLPANAWKLWDSAGPHFKRSLPLAVDGKEAEMHSITISFSGQCSNVEVPGLSSAVLLPLSQTPLYVFAYPTFTWTIRNTFVCSLWHCVHGVWYSCLYINI